MSISPSTQPSQLLLRRFTNARDEMVNLNVNPTTEVGKSVKTQLLHGFYCDMIYGNRLEVTTVPPLKDSRIIQPQSAPVYPCIFPLIYPG
jgi:hypothetical protein